MARVLRNNLLLACVVASFCWSGTGWSRAEETLAYTKAQSFRSALRYLRVDQGFRIVEKDMESGYLLFEYPNSPSTAKENAIVRGSVEVIERSEETALIVQLPELPTYHERMIIEGLLEKLRRDYGEPPKRRAPSPPSEDDGSGPPDREPEPEPNLPEQP